MTGTRYARARVAGPGRRETAHPHLRIDLDACILCRLCVRACSDVQGQFVYAVTGRGAGARLSWSGGPDGLAGGDCTSCGLCTAVCPTGAITDLDRQRAAAAAPSQPIRTTCSYCGVGCQLEAHVAGGDVVRIEGAPSPVNHGHLCVKGRYAHGFTRHPDRLTTPLLRRNGRLEPITWEEALAVAARELGRLGGRVALLSSSRCTNEENYLVQKWFRGGLGTNHIDCCARVCHGPCAAGMRRVSGTGAATNCLADIERADLLLVAGQHHREPSDHRRPDHAGGSGRSEAHRRRPPPDRAREHGRRPPGPAAGDQRSPAQLAGLRDGGGSSIDRSLHRGRTSGLGRIRSVPRARFPPEPTEEITAIPAEAVRRAARLYGQAQRPMQAHGLGITEHFQGIGRGHAAVQPRPAGRRYRA